MSNKLVDKSIKIKVSEKSCSVEEKKAQILVRLQKAIQKLHEARQEVHKLVLLTMNLKENSDDIADEVLNGVIQAFTDYKDFSLLSKQNKLNN